MSVDDVRQAFADAKQWNQKEPDADTGGFDAKPFVWRNPSTLPRRQWLYQRHYIRKFVTADAGPPASGKSIRTTVDAVSMAIGRDLFTGEPMAAPLRVWLYSTEDPQEEIDRKVMAVCKRYGITAADLGGRFGADPFR